MARFLSPEMASWLDQHAEQLDTSADGAPDVLPLLAMHGLLDTSLSDAVSITTALAERSLAAAFTFWAQRSVIECVRCSPNAELGSRVLPALTEGRLAGAPGLSNAMKSLGGLESLRVLGTDSDIGASFAGHIPWATNLRPDGFVLITAAGIGERAAVYAIPNHVPGVIREGEPDLFALRGTGTASVRLLEVVLDDGWCVHPDATVFLPLVRPRMVALQCGLGLGLALASLDNIRQRGRQAAVPSAEVSAVRLAVEAFTHKLADLAAMLEQGSARPAELITLRLQMIDLAAAAVMLELRALGGAAYLSGHDGGFQRRWRELAFLPILTPTQTQLAIELQRLQSGSP